MVILYCIYESSKSKYYFQLNKIITNVHNSRNNLILSTKKHNYNSGNREV